MHLEHITNSEHPMYQEAWDLYQAGFPSHEQRETFSQKNILGERDYHFCLLYDGAAFVGIVLYWETMYFIYIEHLCILPEKRNKQYGQKALSLLKEKKKVLILEIDPPIDDISRRRRGFYERCGFITNPFHHIHPPYHRGNEGHALVIMTYPRRISEHEYKIFIRYLQDKIMDHAFESF